MSSLEKICVRLETSSEMLLTRIDLLQEENEQLRKKMDLYETTVLKLQELLNASNRKTTELLNVHDGLRNSRPMKDKAKTSVAAAALKNVSSSFPNSKRSDDTDSGDEADLSDLADEIKPQ